MEKNIKLFPYYRLFSCDMLFFYAISTLYLLEIKGLNISQIGMISGFYCLFSIITQIPASIICDKLGLKKTMLLGNALLIVYCICIMLFSSYSLLIFCEVISAAGFALKGCSESPFLYSSLKKLGREHEHSKVESKGDFFYYVIDGISCIVSGYLYKMNSSLPIIMATLFFIISAFICYMFISLPKKRNSDTPKEYLKELQSGFKFIFKSPRLRSLLIFSFSFVGIIYVASFLFKAFLTELNASAQTFGYIYAGMAILAAIGALLQKRIEFKFRNQTLSIIALTFIITIIFIGIFLFLPINKNLLLISGSIFFLFQALLKGCYWITMRIYLSRYTTSNIRPKIMSIYNLIRNAGSFILLSIVTPLVNIISLALCFVLVGAIFFVAAILVAAYMDSRVGLDPSKYTTKDRFDLAMEELTKLNK